jgi:hypothetical protein
MNYIALYNVFNTFAKPIYDINPKFMKNYYLFAFLIYSLIINAQNNCDDANSYLVSAYSHVKNAYDSNNISHLKYYANRSVESFKLSKKTLETCGCENALKLADKGIDLLTKVEKAETFEDGRFFVNRARTISKESVIEIDKCSMIDYSETLSINDFKEDKTLNDLQVEQLKLEQQQEALKLKETEIKTKLAEQKEKELSLKKKALILSYENAISSNLETYNSALSVCTCNHKTLKSIKSSEDLFTKKVEFIKTYYTNNLKILASNYISELETCN